MSAASVLHEPQGLNGIVFRAQCASNRRRQIAIVQQQRGGA